MGSKGWFAIAIITVPLCHAELVLRGRVVDENDAPVASALVSVHPAAAASPTLEARTDPSADRYPANFDLNLAIERMVMLHGYRFALRGGVNNLTNQMNPTAVNNVVGAPQFLHSWAAKAGTS